MAAPQSDPRFPETHWSIVLAAQGGSAVARRALGKLCAAYWYPLYAYARRRGLAPEHAADVTQDFFLRLIERNSLGNADPARGRFRSFLLGAMSHVIDDDARRSGAQKRGGGGEAVSFDALDAEARYRLEPATAAAPESEFDRQWAEALVARALERLRHEWERGDGHAGRFAALRPFLLQGRDGGRLIEVAAGLGLGEGAARSLVHRLRARFGELLRAEVALTVPDETETDAELRHLLTALSA